MSGPRTFRLRPSPRARLYVDVVIHPTLGALRRHIRRWTRAERARVASAYGWTCRFTYHGRPHHPQVCEIHLAATCLQPGVIAHECYHAALGWARRARVPLVELRAEPRPDVPRGHGGWDSAEERVARAMQRLVAGVTARCAA